MYSGMYVVDPRRFGPFYRHRPRHGARRALPIVLTILGVDWPFSAQAESACPFRVSSSVVAEEWLKAVRDVENRLQGVSGGGDCAHIELGLRGRGVEIVLVTRNGQRASRELAEPFELDATVQALLMSADALPPRAVVADSQSDVPIIPEVPLAPKADRAVASESPAPSLNRRIVLGGTAGARVGDRLLSPVWTILGSLDSGPWELGVRAQWESGYSSPSGVQTTGWSASGLAAGISIGQRRAVSRQLDLRAGVLLAGAVLHQETHHEHPEHWLLRTDVRLGGDVGAVWPTRGPVRLRLDLGFDVVADSGQPRSASPELPSLPSWAATVSLGAETNGP